MTTEHNNPLSGYTEAPVFNVGVLQEWARDLEFERGLNKATVRTYLRWAEPFVLHRKCRSLEDWAATTAGDVTSFLLEQMPQLKPAARQRTVTALRSLLRFLYTSGYLATRLDPVVPLLAHQHTRFLPRWIAADDVAATITACDVNTVLGRRDQAIVVIIARLGLRACEVSRLNLDDIHWNQGTLLVHGKGDYLEMVPLPADVGNVLALHLSDLRSTGSIHRAVFLTIRAPLRRLSSAAVGFVVTAAGSRAGLNNISAHRLRHSVATETLNAGASLEETGQLLRHRSLQSTTIYAKVDQASLAAIARPWPDSTVVPTGIGD